MGVFWGIDRCVLKAGDSRQFPKFREERTMKKRILSAVLVVLLFLLLPQPVMAAGSYTIGVKASSTISVGSDIAVTLDLSKSTAEAYNAYDVCLTYDAARLTYKACSLPADQVIQTPGSIRLVGYGVRKEKTTALAVLTFTAKAEGTANVQVDWARIDRSSNAIHHNAPQAAYDRKAAVITVRKTYPVTLGDGLTADSLEAVKGQNYTFRATDYDNYAYTVTARIGNQKITVTDHKNGTYTIGKEQITGNITVEAVRTPKTYTVTFTGQDVAGERTAAYNTDYTFSLSRKSGYDYTVKVTIGGKAYSKYDLREDAYTIPGTDITGNIAVTVTKTQKSTSGGTTSGSTTSQNNTTNKTDSATTLKVEFAGSGNEDVTGSKTATRGKAYTFRLNKEDGYRYDVSVQIEGKTAEYTYDAEKYIYTVPAASVTGNITVVVAKTVAVEITEYITLDEQSIYLLLVRGTVKAGQVPKFDGQSMYRSDLYPGYTWLIQSAEGEESVRKLAEEKIIIAEGNAEAMADHSGNVDRIGEIDINDAQLAYGMYSAQYQLGAVPSMEFLGADVNGDRYVNILDVQRILNGIRVREQGGVR